MNLKNQKVLTGRRYSYFRRGLRIYLHRGNVAVFSTVNNGGLVVVPLFVGVTFLSAPIIRKQLREQAEANARVQNHLVETVGGMETIKGQSMEIHSRWRWQQLYGGQISSGSRMSLQVQLLDLQANF